MGVLFFLTTLLLVSTGVNAFNVLGYANPFMGFPLKPEWISIPPLPSFTNGFFPGIFWKLLEVNATRTLLKMATDLMLPLAPVVNETGTHDIGFVIMSSFGHAYRLLKQPDYLDIVVNTAATLSKRYSPTVRCTRSWNSKEGFLVIIDNMMNLEVLFEAANLTNNQTLYNMAWQRANRTIYEHFRVDNSTYHVVEYNETDGSVIRKYTAQGYADWSTWSRGHAWSVYGFTVAYRYTKYQPFLDKAVGAANYFLSRLPSSSDMVPYWDFDAPGNSTIPYQPRDTSAAAIFTSGLVELSQYVTDPTLKDKFLNSAKAIIDQLATPSYLILGNKDYVLRAVMANGTQGPYPKNPFDVATIFGDYYLTETVLRLTKLGQWF